MPMRQPVASGATVTIFNIKGNTYRLITAIHYNTRIVFIRDYMTHAEYSKNDEAEHDETQVGVRGIRGVDVLCSLMEDHAMSGADLSRLLGASRSLGPMILRSDRNLTTEHARVLSARFQVDPGVFDR